MRVKLLNIIFYLELFNHRQIFRTEKCLELSITSFGLRLMPSIIFFPGGCVWVFFRGLAFLHQQNLFLEIYIILFPTKENHVFIVNQYHIVILIDIVHLHGGLGVLVCHPKSCIVFVLSFDFLGQIWGRICANCDYVQFFQFMAILTRFHL